MTAEAEPPARGATGPVVPPQPGLVNLANAISLIVVGVISDRMKVRKPFMLIGGVGAILFLSLIYSRTPHTDTSYRAWSWILVGVVCVVSLIRGRVLRSA